MFLGSRIWKKGDISYIALHLCTVKRCLLGAWK